VGPTTVSERCEKALDAKRQAGQSVQATMSIEGSLCALLLIRGRRILSLEFHEHLVDGSRKHELVQHYLRSV
jgi:hypothetical protein